MGKLVSAKIRSKASWLSTNRSPVLEPMKIADTISYGNYFKIPVMDEYLIQLAIDVPNRNSQIQARFQYVYGGK